MSCNKCTAALLLLLGAFPSICSAAHDASRRTDEHQVVEPYEANIVGYTWQEDDVGFIDITLSLKYQMFREHISQWTCSSPDRCQDRWRAYLAFTGRFGFYYGTRSSDPVISKTFNPKLLIRYTPDPGRSERSFWTKNGRGVFEDWSYIDFAYAHESNGQTIGTGAEYALEQRADPGHPEFALDKVSRGWDYVQVAGKYSFLRGGGDERLAAYGDIRWFLDDGFLQGPPEEYHTFENDPAGKRRRAVEGLTFALEYERKSLLIPGKKGPILADPRIMLQAESGYDPAFRHGTFRFEIGATLIELPLAVWYEDGYGSSLARYYKRARSIGVELRLAQ